MNYTTARSHGTESTQPALTDGEKLYELNGEPMGDEFHDIDDPVFDVFAVVFGVIGLCGLLVVWFANNAL